MATRKIAYLTGWALILMALVAAIAIGYAFGEASGAISSAHTYPDLEEGLIALKIAFTGIIIIVLLDFFVSYTFYRFFENCRKSLAFASSFLRVVYTFIFLYASLYLVACFNLGIESQREIVANLYRFNFIWSVGLIIFGCHLIFLGYLMKIHNQIPNYLAFITIAAGLSYSCLHALKTIFPSALALAATLELILMLPMIAGELGLAVWLIRKGGR